MGQLTGITKYHLLFLKHLRLFVVCFVNESLIKYENMTDHCSGLYSLHSRTGKIYILFLIHCTVLCEYVLRLLMFCSAGTSSIILELPGC